MKAFRIVAAAAIAAALLGPAPLKAQTAPPTADPAAASDPAEWRREDLRTGWRASKLMGAEVKGSHGSVLGKIADLLVAAPGQVDAIAVRIGGTAGEDGLPIRVDWDQVDLGGNLKQVGVPYDAEGFRALAPTSRMGPDEVADKQVSGWSVRRLLEAQAEMTGDVPLGRVDDLIIGRAGEINGVVIRPETSSRAAAGLYAVPWRVVTVEPGGDVISVPLQPEQIGQLEGFDYSALRSAHAD